MATPLLRADHRQAAKAHMGCGSTRLLNSEGLALKKPMAVFGGAAAALLFVCAVKFGIEFARLPPTPPSMSCGYVLTFIDNSSTHWKFCTVRWREVRGFTLDDHGRITSVEY